MGIGGHSEKKKMLSAEEQEFRDTYGGQADYRVAFEKDLDGRGDKYDGLVKLLAKYSNRDTSKEVLSRGTARVSALVREKNEAALDALNDALLRNGSTFYALNVPTARQAPSACLVF